MKKKKTKVIGLKSREKKREDQANQKLKKTQNKKSLLQRLTELLSG